MSATLWQNDHFGGAGFDIPDSIPIPVIPPPLHRGAKSLRMAGTQWMTFWESDNFDTGDDSLWIAPPGAGFAWNLEYLGNVPRPHGNNHWGDRISGVSFSGSPTGDNDNRTIIHEDGHITVGNNRVADRSIDELVAKYKHWLERVVTSAKKEKHP
jgi:hypothetical protein